MAVASIRVQIRIPGTLSMRFYLFAMRLQFEAKEHTCAVSYGCFYLSSPWQRIRGA